jgi:glycosyltransferase involved in cell wall biosynthesis
MDAKKRILVVTQYFYPETFRINSLCTELVKRGYDVTVLTGYPNYPQGEFYEGYGPEKPYEKDWSGVKICRVPIKPRGKKKIDLILNYFSFVASGRKWAKKCTEKYDICYVFQVSPITLALPAVKYKKKHGTPIYMNVQDLWPENVEVILGLKNKFALFFLNKLVDYIYSYCDKILCASQSFVGNIRNRGVAEDKLVYWPQFCDDPVTDSEVKPQEYDYNAFRIVFTGNIGEAQGLDIVLQAAQKLKEKQIEHIKWYLVGDGRAKEKLQEQVKRLGLNDHVIFIDKKPEHLMGSYLKNADCAFLSLMNNKIFEMTVPAKMQTYLSYASPILAASGGEVAKLIENAGNGICVPSGDAEKLAEAAVRMAAYEKQALKDMGENSYKYYKANFEKKQLIDKLEELFNNG